MTVLLGSLTLIPVGGVISDELQDPTRPYKTNVPENVRKAQQQFILEGIIKGSEGVSALINGKLVRPGQQIAGHRVITIGRDHVILGSGPEQQKLHLLSESFKTDSTVGGRE